MFIKKRIEKIKENEEEVKNKTSKDIVETLYFSKNFKSAESTQ